MMSHITLELAAPEMSFLLGLVVNSHHTTPIANITNVPQTSSRPRSLPSVMRGELIRIINLTALMGPLTHNHLIKLQSSTSILVACAW